MVRLVIFYFIKIAAIIAKVTMTEKPKGLEWRARVRVI